MTDTSKKTIIPGGVDDYILACPQEVQATLSSIRSVIRGVAPDAIETVSYFGIPGYSLTGYDYNGMFAWFSYKKPYIRLHVRPPVAQNHKQELKGCKLSTGNISFPEEHEISPARIEKLVNASLHEMKKSAKPQ